MLTLKDHVAGNAEFQYYRAGNLMYKTSTGLEFPIPVDDTNDATFPRTEKGIFFMRWIRKQMSLSNVSFKVSPDMSAGETNLLGKGPIVSEITPSNIQEHTKHKFTT